jgi:hypothetical protein
LEKSIGIINSQKRFQALKKELPAALGVYATRAV